MRQQRRSNARGQVQYPNRRSQPDITWSVSRSEDFNVFLTPDIAAGQLLVVGVPAVTSSSTGQTCTAAVVVGAELQLVFPSHQPPPTTLVITTQDPGVRTVYGAYLAAGSQVLINSPQPTDPVPTAEWTVSSIVDGYLPLSFTAPPKHTCMIPRTAIQNMRTSENPDEIRITSLAVSIHFVSGMDPGDLITVSDVLLSTSQPGAEYTVLAPGSGNVP